MWNRFVVWLTNYSLSRSTLTLKQRNEIVGHIMKNLQALPIHGIIIANDTGEILINGRSLDFDKMLELKQAAKIALENKALKVVSQEVLYASVVGGIHKATSAEDLYFYRAAIWFGQQLESQLKILAQAEE